MPELYCPISGRLQVCKKAGCVLWDKDMLFKGQTGGCMLVKAVRDLGEIRNKIK